jgi:hypothetical protein
MAAFASAFASLKAAGDIAKALVNLRDTTAFQTQLIELQGQILSAQSSALTAQTDQSVLLDRKRDLEEEVARLKVWEVEKERYQLTNIRPPNAPGGKRLDLCVESGCRLRRAVSFPLRELLPRGAKVDPPRRKA